MTLIFKILGSLISTVSVLFIVSFWSDPVYEIPDTGYWAMEGDLMVHKFLDSTDKFSGTEIFELRDNQDITLWYGRYISKDVCISGECKKLKIWLFWDGAGNYLGVQTPEDEILTKSDHEEFSQQDYHKLDSILNDTSSVLKTLKQEDLIVIPEDIDLFEAYRVDGFTAATQPALAEVVVENAVYTCYTLWHTVYGPVRDEVMNLIEARMDEAYLEKMLDSKNPKYVISAIQNLEKNPKYQIEFQHSILELIKHNNLDIADAALNYFNGEILEHEETQLELIRVLHESDVSFKYKIIWKLIETEKVSDPVIIDLLQTFSSGIQSAALYNLSLKLVTPEQFERNYEISDLISLLADSDIPAVRNSTRRFLRKIESI